MNRKINIRKLSKTEKKELYSSFFPEKVSNKRENNLGNLIPGNCFKKSIDEYKWKRYNNKESKKTIMEIERKKKRIAPLWNKGASMYITENENPKTIGKKM